MGIIIFAVFGAIGASAVGIHEEIQKKHEREMERKAICAKYRRAIPRWT